MKNSANFKASWVKFKGVAPALCSSLLQTGPVNAGAERWWTWNSSTHEPVAQRCHWTNFGCWGRAPFWTVSPPPLTLASKLEQCWQKADQQAEGFHTPYIWVSFAVTRASHLGLPCQNFWWGSLSILPNISLQGYVRKYFNDQGKKVPIWGILCIFKP